MSWPSNWNLGDGVTKAPPSSSHLLNLTGRIPHLTSVSCGQESGL